MLRDRRSLHLVSICFHICLSAIIFVFRLCKLLWVSLSHDDLWAENPACFLSISHGNIPTIILSRTSKNFRQNKDIISIPFNVRQPYDIIIQSSFFLLRVLTSVLMSYLLFGSFLEIRMTNMQTRRFNDRPLWQ